MKAGSIILILLIIGAVTALIYFRPTIMGALGSGGTPLSVGGTGAATMDTPTNITCSTAADCKAWMTQQQVSSDGVSYKCTNNKCVFTTPYVPTDTGGAQ